MRLSISGKLRDELSESIQRAREISCAHTVTATKSFRFRSSLEVGR